MNTIRLFVLLLSAPVALRAQTNPNDHYIAVRAPIVVLTHARVIDGSGRASLENQTLVLKEGRIATHGSDGSVTVPDGSKVLDLTGKSVLPGLVMVHEHLFCTATTAGGDFSVNEMGYSFPRLYLAAGITTMRTAGCIQPYKDLILKEAIDAGRYPGPKLHLTMPYIDGEEKQSITRAVKDRASAVRMVEYWAEEGFTSVKVYQNLPLDIMRVTIEAAHHHGLPVTGHLGKVTYREAAEAGIDNLEHGFWVMSDFSPGRAAGDPPDSQKILLSLSKLDPQSAEFNELVKLLIEKGVAVTSTLAVFETVVPGRPVAGADALAAMAPPLRETYLSRWSEIARQNSSLHREAFARELQLEAKFFCAGGLLVVGTDPTGYGGVIPGYASCRAIELLVEAGLTPLEAIKVATFNGAKLLKIDDQAGSISTGKSADLVVVNGDPSKTISDLRKVETVFKDGIGYDSALLFARVKGKVGIQ